MTAPTPSGGSGAHRAPHAQRYAMRFDDEVMCMEEADEGGYVSFDDYETLRQQYDVTAAALLAARRGEHAAREELAAAEEAESGRFRTHREWALANVRRAEERRPKALSCGHNGAEFQTCVVCAHDLGRREGQVEAGAYLFHDEAMSNIRAALAATPEGK